MENPNFAAPPVEGQSASSEESSFAEILSQFERSHHSNGGQAIHGTVVSITPESVFVDIGRKMDGVIPIENFRDSAGEASIHVGDRLLVTITGRDEEGSYSLSTIKVERPRDWSALESAFAEQRAIGGVVAELVKGGLRVDVGAKAFMPASRSGARDQAEMERLVGQEIQCKIIKLDTASEDIVVDRRVILEQEAARSKEEAFSNLREGDIVRGAVRSLTDFGAFIELAPGIDGLLHVTDMAWRRIGKPSDVVSAGEWVEVKILKMNAATRRISLGMKQLIPDPWSVVGERFHVGERVQGKVSRLSDFGAFVELAPGVDGLIHVSEMSWSKKVRKPGDLVKVGDLVEAVVLGINPAEHRISLGLKQALGDPWEEAKNKYAPGAVVEGPVSSLTNFGAFVDLGGGLEGMIHVSDISREKRLTHPREALAAGQTVRAVVLELDREKRRIRLGMKQLEPTSVDEYIGEHKAGDTVSGRVVDARKETAKVELGEGVFAECRMTAEAGDEVSHRAQPAKADLSSLTAMLSAKWKEGGAAASPSGREPARPGQVRSFRIVRLDPAKKKIELELAD